MNRYGIILLLLFSFTIPQTGLAQTDFDLLREKMVNEQLVRRGIRDQGTLKAMRTVKRHLFVPEEARKLAYTDSPLSIGKGQTISQPYIVAFMTQELAIQPTDRVLEIGTGSGYQAAVLSELAKEVYTIEIVEELMYMAKARLSRLGYDNVKVRAGDGYHGWPEKEPFDAIIVTAGVESIPQPLVDQLAEGGRMIIPVGPKRQTRQLVLLTKKKGKIKKRNRMPVVFVEFTRNKD